MITQPPTVAKLIRMGASDTRYNCTPWFVLCAQKHLPMRSSGSFFTLAMAAKMHFEGDIQTQATDQLVFAHIQQLVEDWCAPVKMWTGSVVSWVQETH